jgi:inhibitor of KinA
MIALHPLGDQAALAYLMDENAAVRFAARVRRANPRWLVDVVQAYTSVAVFYDLDLIGFAEAVAQLQGLEAPRDEGETAQLGGKQHRLPCCYEFQLDLDCVARHTGLSPEEIIRLHCATEYTVYAIGFCPGFPYLGYLPPPLSGVPRLETPRLRLEAGSVGLTGRQTGIYTLPRPGGWNLIGRTPLELVHVADGYFPLRTGDRVRFTRIDAAEFRRLEGERL